MLETTEAATFSDVWDEAKGFYRAVTHQESMRGIGALRSDRIASLLIAALILLLLIRGQDAGAFDRPEPPRPQDTLWGMKPFWRWSILDRNVRYQTQALLTKISMNAYWYVEKALTDKGDNYTAAQMDSLGAAFDSQVLPRLHAAFGYEPLPPSDIDNDSRITILIYDDIGVSYFDPRNELPTAIDPTSNEREMVYIQFEAEPNRALSTIAHETTHLIEWSYHPAVGDWVDEGLAAVGSLVAGFPYDFTVNRFLNDTRVGLVRDRGAGQLFVTYLMEHYGGMNLTRALTQNGEDGFPRIQDTLRGLGLNLTIALVFRDWVIANAVNHGTAVAKYRYSSVTRQANLTFRSSDYPWSGKVQDLENGGAAYIGIANFPSDRLRAEVQAASFPGLFVFLVVQTLDDILIVEGRATAADNALDFGPIPPGASLTLVVSYLNEGTSSNASVEVGIRLASPDTQSAWFLILIGVVTIGVPLFVLTMRQRRRKSRDRPPEGRPNA